MKAVLDWKEYQDTAIQAIAEGCVLLKNDKKALPLRKGETVSVFGRIQDTYYKSGTGSGGMVNVSKVYGIVDGLKESGYVEINEELHKIYTDWEKEHPYDEGLGWGKERWSQDEMPLTDKIVSDAAAGSQVAIAIIGRTAGEDRDAGDTPGSYRLTPEEEDMLAKVRKGFERMVVLLNVGSIMDMSFVERYNPDAVMYVWQGGMLGGLGTAKVLCGEVSPCGKLTDTIAYKIEDYPSNANFGNEEKDIYAEDIFVGYRYFETFAKDKVQYPFGYGLSYTSFRIAAEDLENNIEEKEFSIEVTITNTGEVAGKEAALVFVEAPNGKLGKAARVLGGFDKTEVIEPGEAESFFVHVPYDAFASYDDSGVTGHKSAFVLEAGEYKVYVGRDVRSAEFAGSFTLEELLVLRQCEEALTPVEAFDRMHAGEKGELTYEAVPTRTYVMGERQNSRIPTELAKTNEGIQLVDVYRGNATLEELVGSMTDEDLASIVRGEGMGSSLVTPGTASAFGGVSKRLRETFGIPAVCCDDGPSGMRLDCGIKAFSLPNGIMLACSFNRDLVRKLYSFTGLEMVNNHVENLLGPGMNIHRHPLNGRNFEYFSEDPFVTGVSAIAMLEGLHTAGVTGTVKHFCANNQEYKRHFIDSVVSERALREIYLKGYEMATRAGAADSVMTTYGSVNGLYTAGNYDLNTTILRMDWGFEGIVMTDWWAMISEMDEDRVATRNKTNHAAMVRAQNDLYMVCSSGEENADGDNTLEALQDGRLHRSELQKCAMNICKHVMKTQAFKRFIGEPLEVEVVGRPEEDCDMDLSNVETVLLDGDKVIDLTYQECKANTNYILAFDVQKTGRYKITLVASSPLDSLAQLPVTMFYIGAPFLSYTFHGTNGGTDEISREFTFNHRFSVTRFFVGCNGLELKEARFEYLGEDNKENFSV